MSKLLEAIASLKADYRDVSVAEATGDVSALRSILVSAASTLKTTGENVGRALNAIDSSGVAVAITEGDFTSDGRETAMTAWLKSERIDLDRRRVSEWREAARRIDGIAVHFDGKVSASAVKSLKADADLEAVAIMFKDMVADGIAISNDKVKVEGRKRDLVAKARKGGDKVKNIDISPAVDGDTPVTMSDSIIAHEAYNTLNELVKGGFVLPMGLAKSMTALVARSNKARTAALKATA